MAKVDDERIRAVIAGAIGGHACLSIAREHGVYVLPARDEAIELAAPLAPRLARTLVKVPWTSRVLYEDLEQSALEGIIEGIDSFEPARTYVKRDGSVHLVKPSSHLFWRVRKRVFMEVQETHWLLAKPSREDVESYMKGIMDDQQRYAYVNAVLNPVAGYLEDSNRSRHGVVLHDGMSAAAYAHRESMQ